MEFLVSLALSLFVGYAFCLGSAGALGGESKNDEGDKIGKHAVQVWAYADFLKPENTVAVNINTGVAGCNALEQTEEEGGTGNVQGLPVTENHNSESEEAEACNVTVRRAVSSGEGIYKAAHAGEEAGYGSACIAHFCYIDAERVRGLGIFTAGTQSETELCFVKNY